jgi:hypothetical protein
VKTPGGSSVRVDDGRDDGDPPNPRIDHGLVAGDARRHAASGSKNPMINARSG